MISVNWRTQTVPGQSKVGSKKSENRSWEIFDFWFFFIEEIFFNIRNFFSDLEITKSFRKTARDSFYKGHFWLGRDSLRPAISRMYALWILLRCPDERRPPALLRLVHVGARVEQRPDHLDCVSARTTTLGEHRSVEDRRPPVPVRLAYFFFWKK